MDHNNDDDTLVSNLMGEFTQPNMQLLHSLWTYQHKLISLRHLCKNCKRPTVLRFLTNIPKWFLYTEFQHPKLPPFYKKITTIYHNSLTCNDLSHPKDMITFSKKIC